MWRSGFTSSCLFYSSLTWTGDEHDLAQTKCFIHVLSFLHPFLIVV
jgi:hypothetical protein